MELHHIIMIVINLRFSFRNIIFQIWLKKEKIRKKIKRTKRNVHVIKISAMKCL